MKTLYFEIRNTIKIRERQSASLVVKPAFEIAHKQLEEAPLSFIIQIPESLIRQGIKDHDNDVFIYLYKELFPKVKRYVVRNKGNSNIAQDIFQETMVDILIKSDNGTLNPTKSVKGYIVTIAINKWRKANTKNNKIKESLVTAEDNLTDERYPIADSSMEITDSLEPTDNFDIISIWLDELSDKCKNLINERIKNKNWDTVAADLGYKDAKSARTQNYKCMERLREYENSKRLGLLGEVRFSTINTDFFKR